MVLEESLAGVASASDAGTFVVGVSTNTVYSRY